MLFIASVTNLLKMHLNLIATTQTTGSAALFIIIGLIFLAYFIFIIISYFKVFEKAGRKS